MAIVQLRQRFDLDAVMPEACFQHDDEIDDLIAAIREGFGSRGYHPHHTLQGAHS
jgi:hypothetical protein